jgi:hypothetical protein
LLAAALVEPYGGIHRIFFPRLLFIADYRFFSGMNIFPMTVTIVMHLIAALLIIRNINRQQDSQPADRWVTAGIVLMCFFSAGQIYNLIYISDNQVPMGNSLAILAGILFFRDWQLRTSARPGHGNLWLECANITVVLAGLCHSSSLMIWPAMLVMMLVNRYPAKIILTQSGLFAVLLLIYVSGYDPLDQGKEPVPVLNAMLGPILGLVMNLGGIIKYIGLYLSSPLSRSFAHAGMLLSALSIVYLLINTWRSGRSPQVARPALFICLLLMWYILFVAGITAHGRQIYPNSAFTDRYQTLVMVYWAACFAMLFYDLKNLRPSLGLVSPLLLTAATLFHYPTGATEMGWLSSRVRMAHTAAINNINDIRSVAGTLSHPLLMNNRNLVAEHHRFLKEHQLGYFNTPESQLLDTLLDPPAGQSVTCELSLQKVNQGQGFYKLTGEFTGFHPDSVLVTDKNRLVIGIGRSFREKGDILPAFRQNTLPWTGYINIQSPVQFPLVLHLTGQSTQSCQSSPLTREMFYRLARK